MAHRTRSRVPRFAATLILVAGGAAVGGCSETGPAEEPLGAAEQEATCVNLRRTPALPGAVYDARLNAAATTTNYGAATTLVTGPSDSALLWFDLSSIPAGAAITQAALKLTETGDYSGALRLHQVSAAWSEGVVTYASFGNAYVSPPAYNAVNAAGVGIVTLPATSVVSQWVSGAAPNQGFAVRQPSGTSTFASSEDGTATRRPTLTVCYNAPTCSDGLQNQGETGVDCGGPCPACASCSDGVQNQGEAGVDCGGPCPACASCSDSVQNQGEAGVDCGGPCSACAALGRAPYVQLVTPTSAVLVWTTDLATNSVVRLGTTPGSPGQTTTVATPTTQHEVTLTGLSPSTRYYYDVGSSQGVLAGNTANHHLTTSPVVGSKGKLRAWVVGDSGTGGTAQLAVRDSLLAFAAASPPDLFLHLGDMAYDSGTTAEFSANFFGVYAGILQTTPVWPTLGNHEGTSSDSGTQTGPYYVAYVTPAGGQAGGVPSGTEAYYSFDWGNVHFVVLDSHDSPRAPAGAMLTWLQQDLASTTQDWLVAYWHHPPYSKGSHDSDVSSQLIEMRQNALPILEAAGVDLVLGGHSHIYERSFLVDSAYDTPTTLAGHLVDGGDGKPLGTGPYIKQAGLQSHDGAVYVVAGHGGAAVSGAGNHPLMYMSELANGSCVLDVQDNRLSLLNLRSDGAKTDQFTITKGPAVVVAAPDGNETLVAGSTFAIRWVTTGATATVNLEYSLNDGQTFSPIATVPNTGSYAWVVPAGASTQALVRVTDAANPALSDESNGAFTIPATSLVTAIPFGSTWRYDDSGTDRGTAWLALAYDDSLWGSGAAQLGYGDGDEVTLLFKASPVRPSYYFRKVVSVSGTVLAGTLQVRHDDGYAVWINGTLVASKYMGNGTNYPVWATQASAENELSTTSLTLSPSPFVAGNNVVAVMVKQANSASSDVSFDLALDLTVGP